MTKVKVKVKWWMKLDAATRRQWHSYAAATMNRCAKDQEAEAIEAGFMAGVRYAMQVLPERIRAELVCCPPEHIDALQKAQEDGAKIKQWHTFHDLCYWGEMSARLAEDPHSLMDNPYSCDGQHPGECWSGTKV